MVSTSRRRGLAIGALVLVLIYLFVWAGTIQPDPASNTFPTEDEFATSDADRYVGERVTVSGTVVATDPLTFEAEPDTGPTITLVVENAAIDATVGDHVSVHGILHESNRIEAHDVVHRDPWELTYMYAISTVAALWVLGRFLNQWTISTDTWAVVPLNEPRSQYDGGDQDA